MGSIMVPFSTCDFHGCSAQWPEMAKNGNLEVVLGVHPIIASSRREPVVLLQKTFNFCPEHANVVKEPLMAAAVWHRGRVDPNFDPKKGCWLTVWCHNGELDQTVLNHQFPYECFEILYRYFTRNFLSLPED